MRILFSFVGGRGHFEPLTAVARAVMHAGHVVAFACPPGMAATVAAEGFDTLPTGAASQSPPAARLPLRPPDATREERDLRERFVRRAARDRVPRMISLCEEWRPDVLVCDETDFGALIAAERIGLPYAAVVVIGAGGFVRADVVAQALDELRAEHGLAADPTLQAWSRHLVLSSFPVRYRDPAHPLPGSAECFRPTERATRETIARPWQASRPDAPSVYFTLGTVFNTESGDLLSRVVAGLRELPVELVVTVGDAIDPLELGPQPDHVHVARSLPQSSILPHCHAVVSHGGSGSVLGALAHGLPSLLIPIGADQPLNARRCEQLGVARVLDPMDATPETVRDAGAAVLADVSLRRNAEQIAREISALPDALRAVEALERLAAPRG